MTSENEPLRITNRDLFSTEVDEFIETQEQLRRDVGEIHDQSLLVKIIYANWFYLAICSAFGGLAGWAILEPFFDDNRLEEEWDVASTLMFPTVVGFVGLFLGAAEGLMCRNPLRAVISGAIGLAIGFIGGLISLIPTGIVFSMMTVVAASFSKDQQLDGMPTGMALLIFMMGRAMAWSIASLPAGLGQGIAIREGKVIVNGLIGAVLGGLLGGILFDPISMVLVTADGEATYSRAVGFSTIGLFVGLFIGLVEGWTKTAWLLMKKGPLAGKQFILYKDQTTLGSTPKAEIYLFKDDAIEPRHAVITNRGGRFEIEDLGTPDGTYVNGVAIKRHILQKGDQIVLGKTVLEFTLRDSK